MNSSVFRFLTVTSLILISLEAQADTVFDNLIDPANCAGALQGKIAWNYEGNKMWQADSVKRLCSNSPNAEPAKCFNKAMHGDVSWGASSQWHWQNAIDLCEGSSDAARTITCFSSMIDAGEDWAEAIEACDERSGPATGTISDISALDCLRLGAEVILYPSGCGSGMACKNVVGNDINIVCID